MTNNILKKYSSSPTVFVLETDNFYSKDEVVKYETKYGKEIDLIIWKLVFSRNGKNYYSYIREDGKSRKTILENKIEKRNNWSKIAETKSSQFFDKSQQDKEFLSLAEPVKIGHHSEKKHRAIIEKAWNNTGKSVEYSNKSQLHSEKAENIQLQLDSELPLDTPDCFEAIEQNLKKAVELHKFYKENPEKRAHSFSLTYAKKKVNDLQKRLEIATKLWK